MLGAAAAVVALLLLAWIGSLVSDLRDHVADLQRQLAGLADLQREHHSNATLANSMAREELTQGINTLGVLVAYGIGRRDNPATGLYGESDYYHEKDLTETGSAIESKARVAAQRLAE